MKHLSPPQLVQIEELGRMLLDGDRELLALPNLFSNIAIAGEITDTTKLVEKKLIATLKDALRE